MNYEEIIYASISADDEEQMQFGAEVHVAAQIIAYYADHVATYFDHYVVAAALAVVSADYDHTLPKRGDDDA